METLQLREWTLTPALTLTGPQRDTLRTVLKATVQPTLGSNDRYDVRPGNTVGAVTVDATTFIVEPKIPISQVLFMLGYTADPSAWRQEDASLGAANDLVSGVTALFTNLCDRALRRGLLNGYHSVEADLYTVRGRIDLAEQLRRRPGLDLPLAVRYEQHDEDITENRLLLAAALLLRGLPIGARHAPLDASGGGGPAERHSADLSTQPDTQCHVDSTEHSLPAGRRARPPTPHTA